jgi:hypothetical protein
MGRAMMTSLTLRKGLQKGNEAGERRGQRGEMKMVGFDKSKKFTSVYKMETV